MAQATIALHTLSKKSQDFILRSQYSRIRTLSAVNSSNLSSITNVLYEKVIHFCSQASKIKPLKWSSKLQYIFKTMQSLPSDLLSHFAFILCRNIKFQLVSTTCTGEVILRCEVVPNRTVTSNNKQHALVHSTCFCFFYLKMPAGALSVLSSHRSIQNFKNRNFTIKETHIDKNILLCLKDSLKMTNTPKLHY